MILDRLAPSAARTTTSRSRAVPRAMAIFARFAQPTSRSMPTAAISMFSDWRKLVLTKRSEKRSIVMPQSFFMSG